MWCTGYIKRKQGKLPTKWTLVSDEDTIYDFDPNAFEIGSKISKGNIKYDAEITSNIDYGKMNFRVKLNNLPDFEGKQDSWLNFKASFESIS